MARFQMLVLKALHMILIGVYSDMYRGVRMEDVRDWAHSADKFIREDLGYGDGVF